MNENKQLRVIMSCGGTGGHIYPAIAIVRALENQLGACQILFIGAQGKMEMERVPAEGYEIVGLPIAGFQRSWTITNVLKNLLLPFKVLYSLGYTYWILYKFNPDVVIGTGGYASGPTLKMAAWMGIPTFIQEQNALPGYTNKILANSTRAVFVSFDQMESYFPNSDVYNYGNAIREDFEEGMWTRESAIKEFNLDPNKPIVFVTGGSLGANAINKAIENQIDKLISEDIQLIWQCGKNYLDSYSQYQSKSILTYDFLPNIQAAYAAADIIVSRAGGAIFEMLVVAKPLIVLPSPNVAEDHQTKNAMALQQKNAALMITDSEANERLVPAIIDLLNNKEMQETMKSNLKSMAKPKAASMIASKILELINWK